MSGVDVSSRAIPIPSSSRPGSLAESPGGLYAGGGSSLGGRSSGAFSPASLQEQLNSLRLKASDPATLRAIDRVMDTLKDVITGPGLLSNFMSEEDEAKWWECFAEVFQQEVERQSRASGGREPALQAKRQILADILVWAEVTQEHYDPHTLQFVTQPHATDESFQRIGQMFQQLKRDRGLAAH